MHAKIISFSAEDICHIALSAGAAEQEDTCRIRQGVLLERTAEYV